MVSAAISKSDVIESFVRSSGPGGQNVNKVATCVVLMHQPTGIIIKCQEFRNQFQNRQKAWVLLYEALEERQRQKELHHRAQIEKVRRQNRKPSRSAKEKKLAAKKKRSSKKINRKKTMDWD